MGSASPSILVIDDYPQILRFIVICLRSRGYSVVTASSGDEGLKKLVAGKPDVILLDIRMPDMDGFEFLEKARDLGDCPVVAYSATPEYAGKALHAGARAFLKKPLDLDRLTAVLDDLVGSGS